MTLFYDFFSFKCRLCLVFNLDKFEIIVYENVIFKSTLFCKMFFQSLLFSFKSFNHFITFIFYNHSFKLNVNQTLLVWWPLILLATMLP